jgi:hypothetical protein
VKPFVPQKDMKKINVSTRGYFYFANSENLFIFESPKEKYFTK